MNVYDGVMYANWVMLLFFVMLLGWNLFEIKEWPRKLLAATILIPFLVRLLWLG